MQTLDSIRQVGVIANEIVLRPLSLKDVNQFIADSLRCERVRVKSFARLASFSACPSSGMATVTALPNLLVISLRNMGTPLTRRRFISRWKWSSLWTQPIEVGIDLIRMAFRAGVESGDLSFACYSCMHLVADLLVKGVPLDDVWRESEVCLDFIRKGKYRDAAEVIVSQQQFLRNLRGQTANFSTFSDADFDEQSFEAQLTEDRMTVMVSRYWILITSMTVQARVLVW
jgi:predicted ATPase